MQKFRLEHAWESADEASDSDCAELKQGKGANGDGGADRNGRNESEEDWLARRRLARDVQSGALPSKTRLRPIRGDTVKVTIGPYQGRVAVVLEDHRDSLPYRLAGAGAFAEMYFDEDAVLLVQERAEMAVLDSKGYEIAADHHELAREGETIGGVILACADEGSFGKAAGAGGARLFEIVRGDPVGSDLAEGEVTVRLDNSLAQQRECCLKGCFCFSRSSFSQGDMPYFTVTIHEVSFLQGAPGQTADGSSEKDGALGAGSKDKNNHLRNARAKLVNKYDQFGDGDARGSIGIGLSSCSERLKSELRLQKLWTVKPSRRKTNDEDICARNRSRPWRVVEQGSRTVAGLSRAVGESIDDSYGFYSNGRVAINRGRQANRSVGEDLGASVDGFFFERARDGGGRLPMLQRCSFAEKGLNAATECAVKIGCGMNFIHRELFFTRDDRCVAVILTYDMYFPWTARLKRILLLCSLFLTRRHLSQVRWHGRLPH